ncbi:MAG: restriction endonuclease [Blastocatellia bacterium]|nr:restriction endonuclease [Blastocatellia bacterium]
MQVAGIYSFKNGQEILEQYYAPLLVEVFGVVRSVDATEHKSKTTGRKYNPASIYKSFKKRFGALRWKPIQIRCEHAAADSLNGYADQSAHSIGYRKLDFVKEKLGTLVEIGKPLPISSTCAKMTIFRNLGHIDCGIEIVPVKAFAEEMSSGVSYFEQFIWDLESRGESDIDTPVIIIGIDA